MDPKAVEVVAGLIWDGDRFMICQRPPHKARGLLWEFPGGKVEPGETKEQALVRECREELDVTLAVGSVFMDVLHEYPDITVHLSLFLARIAEGTPKRLEHADIRWIRPAGIPDFDFCPADEAILARIRAVYEAPGVTTLRERLLALRETKNGDFVSRLIPGFPRDRILGARTPDLRRLAKEADPKDAAAFLAALPHLYHEENLLHALLLSRIRDYDAAVGALAAFLPWVDNWAVCDSLRPAAFRRHPAPLPAQLQAWLQSAHPYTVRFALECLMTYYLDDAFEPRYLDWAASLRSEAYYVNMMTAWYLATALVGHWDETLALLTARRLETWTHNKTIQKALESRRIPEDRKNLLRGLRAS